LVDIGVPLLLGAGYIRLFQGIAKAFPKTHDKRLRYVSGSVLRRVLLKGLGTRINGRERAFMQRLALGQPARRVKNRVLADFNIRIKPIFGTAVGLLALLCVQRLLSPVAARSFRRV